MNNNIAIRVERLGKQYQIARRKDTSRPISRVVSDFLFSPFRRLWKLIRGKSGTVDLDNAIWALRDVSFEIPRGEIVGVIGRNGAGKSTLLKILSRITHPTRGTAWLGGRVGSLLEVGTGFHQELTGRENIYLNGVILGMKRKEIDKKFDEIVAFAETEEFLDTPVKHYSSGMTVRLAFAVAAHLEPEILLVDEVLAVGDMNFQTKCLGKMEDVAKTGRTVLFVSHNIAMISALCSRALLLEGGELTRSGSVSEVVSRYFETMKIFDKRSLDQHTDRGGSGTVRFTDVSFLDETGRHIESAVAGKPLSVLLSYATSRREEVNNVDMEISFHGTFGQLLFFCKTHLTRGTFESLPGKGQVRCHIPNFPLNPGRYPFTLSCQVGQIVSDRLESAGALLVEPGDFYGTGSLPTKNPEGIVMVPHHWKILSKHTSTVAVANWQHSKPQEGHC